MLDIDTKNLKIGMYVAHLDRPWLETSFLFQGFLIENDSQIEQLKRVCKTVKVDEEQSARTLSFEPFKSSKATSAPTVAQTQTVQATGQHNKAQSNKVRFEKELEMANQVYEETSVSMNKLLNNFRLNSYITMPEVKTCVHGVVNNVMHNPNALFLLISLRSKRQDTVTHSINVCIVSTLFGRYLGFNSEQLSQLGIAAFLHDIGEAKVPKTILDKHNQGLSPEETLLMQKHTQYGEEMLRKVPEMPIEALEAAHSHHERIDGNGYPRGLKDAEISLMSRMIAIVDDYERLTNGHDPDRHMSCSDALKSLYAKRGTFFDAKLVEDFIKCLGIYPIGSVVRLNNGASGVVIAMKPDKHLLPTVMVVIDRTGEIRHPPQVINLDRYRDQEGKPLLLIDKVIDPSTLSVDFNEYLVKELGVRVTPHAKPD